jgi:hypothetical protein
MSAFRQYWSFSAIRGTMTIVASVAILLLPYFASAILPIPVMLGFAIDCVAAYVLLDAGALFLLGISLPKGSFAGKAAIVETVVAIGFGGALYAMTHGEFAGMLFWVVAAQAAVAAVVQFLIADETHREYGCLSCYASALVLAACALALPFARLLDTDGQVLALALYVGSFGAAQVMLAARMLFVEYRAKHPAAVMSEAWRAQMNRPLPVDRFTPTRGDQPLTVMVGPGGRVVRPYRHAA